MTSETQKKLTIEQQYTNFIEACNAQGDAIDFHGPEGKRDYEHAVIGVMRDFRKCEPYKELVQNGFKRPEAEHIPQSNHSIDRVVRLIEKLAPKRP